MPVSSRGPCRRRSWWCHTPLIDPGYPHACKGGRGSDAAVQARLDRGPHGVPSGSSLAGQPQDSGSLDAQLSHRPADRPHTHTRPGSTHLSLCSRNVTVWQVRSQHIQRPIVPPEPHRTPAQGRVDHLHHHTPAPLSKPPHKPGSQHSDHRTLCRAPDHTHAERQKPDGNPPSQRADHADHNDQATQPSSRQGETPPKALEDSGGRRPLITKDLDPYPQPTTNTHSPTLNSEEPGKCGPHLPSAGSRGQGNVRGGPGLVPFRPGGSVRTPTCRIASPAGR